MTPAAATPVPATIVERPLARVVLLTRDEYDLLDDWVAHHAALFGLRNIVIIDNGSTDPRVLRTYDRLRSAGVTVRVDASPFAQATQFMTRHMAELAAAPDAPEFLLPLETDEFMFIRGPGAALSAGAVRDALAAIPADVSVVRYGAFLGSVVDPADPAYTPARGFDRPARQMTRFFDQGWDKLIVRASAFRCMTQWCHHAAVSRGRTATCETLGLLHFHDTGFRRLVERALLVMRSFGYVDTEAPLDKQLAAAAHVRRSGLSCGHKVEYYDILLRRRAVLEAVRRHSASDGLPSPIDMDALACADPDMTFCGPGDATSRAIAAGLLALAPCGPHGTQRDAAVDELLYWDGGAALGVSRAATLRAGRPQAATDITVTQVRDFLHAMAPPFDTVLRRHQAAHNDNGTDKTTTHAYGPLYARLFDPLREHARDVLEIGVYSGASVVALAEFFEGARITGIDVTLDKLRFGRDNPRIEYRVLDGTRPESATALGRDWDVVLDDASHRPDHQLASLLAFGPRVRPGGMYVIEDIDGRHDGAAALRDGLRELATRIGFDRFEWYDLRHVKGQYDDIVAVMRKSPAPAPAPAPAPTPAPAPAPAGSRASPGTAKARVFTYTKNDHDLIGDFLAYNSSLFGAENVVVVDNMSDHPRVLEAYEAHRARGGVVIKEPRPVSMYTELMTEHMLSCKADADVLIPLGADEFIVQAGESAPSLTAASVSAILREMLDDEPRAGVFRFGQVLAGVVEPERADGGYERQHHTRPAVQITGFVGNGMCKVMYRAPAFQSVVPQPQQSVIHRLCILHLHDTGARRRLERCTQAAVDYGHMTPEQLALPDEQQLAICRNALANHTRCSSSSSIGVNHIEQHVAILRRRIAARAFKCVTGRLPSPAFLDAVCRLGCVSFPSDHRAACDAIRHSPKHAATDFAAENLDEDAVVLYDAPGRPWWRMTQVADALARVGVSEIM